MNIYTGISVFRMTVLYLEFGHPSRLCRTHVPDETPSVFHKLGLYAGTQVGIYVGIFVVRYVGCVGCVGRHLSRGRYSSYKINK